MIVLAFRNGELIACPTEAAARLRLSGKQLGDYDLYDAEGRRLRAEVVDGRLTFEVGEPAAGELRERLQRAVGGRKRRDLPRLVQRALRREKPDAPPLSPQARAGIVMLSVVLVGLGLASLGLVLPGRATRLLLIGLGVVVVLVVIWAAAVTWRTGRVPHTSWELFDDRPVDPRGPNPR